MRQQVTPVTRLTIDSSRPLLPQLTRAVEVVRRQGVVAFPTDTLYGLAADPRSGAALDALFALKGRPDDRAVALVAADRSQAAAMCEFNEIATRIADRFWPGPLTLVLAARATVAPGARSADGRIGIRVPDHPVARALALACGHAITATSANPTGHPPSSLPDEVAELMTGLELLIDAGPSPGGPPSTVIEATGAELRLIRAGAVPWSRVLEFLDAPS